MITDWAASCSETYCKKKQCGGWPSFDIKRHCSFALCQLNSSIYLHFQSKPLMNLKIFATVHSLMNDIKLIDSCQIHLPVQYASNIEFIRQKWHWCCDWQRATPELHVQNNPLVCSFGCPCSHWLFRISVLHLNKTVDTFTSYLQNCFVS